MQSNYSQYRSISTILQNTILQIYIRVSYWPRIFQYFNSQLVQPRAPDRFDGIFPRGMCGGTHHLLTFYLLQVKIHSSVDFQFVSKYSFKFFSCGWSRVIDLQPLFPPPHDYYLRGSYIYSARHTLHSPSLEPGQCQSHPSVNTGCSVVSSGSHIHSSVVEVEILNSGGL